MPRKKTLETGQDVADCIQELIDEPLPEDPGPGRYQVTVELSIRPDNVPRVLGSWTYTVTAPCRAIACSRGAMACRREEQEKLPENSQHAVYAAPVATFLGPNEEN